MFVSQFLFYMIIIRRFCLKHNDRVHLNLTVLAMRVCSDACNCTCNVWLLRCRTVFGLQDIQMYVESEESNTYSNIIYPCTCRCDGQQIHNIEVYTDVCPITTQGGSQTYTERERERGREGHTGRRTPRGTEQIDG